MSAAGSRRLRWLLPAALVAAALLVLALLPGADLEPEVRRFLATVDAGTSEALSSNTGLFPLWDPAELQASAQFLRTALGPLREVLEVGAPQRVERPGIPRRRVQARLRFTRSQQPAQASFEFIRGEAGWSLCDFDIQPPADVPTGARREWAVPEAERLAGLVARLSLGELHMSQLRRLRRATSLDDFSAPITAQLDGLPLVKHLDYVRDEPRGAGWRVVVLGRYEDGQAREFVVDLLPEEGRWRLAGLEVRKP
ncbi:MAG: hypothetical protein ACKOSS_11600 [Planctomycetia bacterium]